METRFVKIDSLFTEGIQSRSKLSKATVNSYAKQIKEGAKFPPIVVFQENETSPLYLADGYHRVAAHQRIGEAFISAEIRTGTFEDAVVFNIENNASHGLPMSSLEKRLAVWKLISDNSFSERSDREIARICGVDHKTVGKYRKLFKEGKSQADAFKRNKNISNNSENDNSNNSDIYSIPSHTIATLIGLMQESLKLSKSKAVNENIEKALSILKMWTS